MPKTLIRTKKQTFSLDKTVVAALDQFARNNTITSKSDFVEQAIKIQLKKKQDDWLSKEFAQAAKDPLFVVDMEAVQRDFEGSDSETIRMIT